MKVQRQVSKERNMVAGVSPGKVSEEIKTWVVDRDLKQGDKLPNEAEMIALFGVSKGTVREAFDPRSRRANQHPNGSGWR